MRFKRDLTEGQAKRLRAGFRGNVDRAFEVEASNYLCIKSSLLFWQSLGSLNTSYQVRTSITFIPISNLDLNPCFLFVDHMPCL